MTWFKVDDTFHSHPKVLAAEPAALGLWVIAGAWCSANLTDGFVPDHALPRLLPGSDELARNLVTAGLWRRAKGGYRFHDWNSYNPSSETVKAERDAARNRMRDLRKKRGSKHVTPDEPDDCSGEQEANVRENFGGSSQPRPDPTRSSSNEELPTHQPAVGEIAKPKKPAATRLPDHFVVTAEMVAWAQAKVPTVDGRAQTEAFIDHWRAANGTTAVKRDWTAAWRTWMRRAAEMGPSRPSNVVALRQPIRSTTDERVQGWLDLGMSEQGAIA